MRGGKSTSISLAGSNDNCDDQQNGGPDYQAELAPHVLNFGALDELSELEPIIGVLVDSLVLLDQFIRLVVLSL